MDKLIKDIKKCYWMKNELVEICRKMGLSTKGDKFELMDRIINKIRGKREIKREILVPSRRPNKISLKTKLSEGVKYDEITRNFFIKHIGKHFHFGYFLNNYMKSNPNKTYGDAIIYYQYIEKNKDKFKKKYEDTNKFQWNNFMKQYRKKHPNASFDEIIEKWNVHKMMRNKNKQLVIKLLLSK